MEHTVLAWIITQCSDFLLVFFDIHHLIIILLAVQRFILYFELGVNVDLSPKTIHVVLFVLYFAEYLKLAIFEVLVYTNETVYLMFREMFLYESIIIHILMFASAILYIPISVRIRRKAHLKSVIKNKPDRFILYQTFGLAAFKLTSLRMHIFYQFEQERAANSFYGNQFNCVTTPVMIQMSDLFSNKRNLDTIKNIFKRNNRTAPSTSLGEARTTAVDT